ncbi:leucine--tRNA ligase [Candidatus Gottesmanbacteria bacterium]|nr:leucine--tRNA ligase [Candidatus Gottesmanbacteria bacterium]
MPFKQPKKVDKLHPESYESKWQEKWQKEKVYQPDIKKAPKPFYNLMMFPYPSAEGLHVGNMYAFTGADIYGRFMRMKGLGVFEPIGLDGFGIHSENYAIKIGKHPAQQAKVSQQNFYRQLTSIGNGFAWESKLETYDPAYYKWTQWIFIQLFKRGLAYRKKSPVNFCPSCKTVLSDEQVIEGRCERCKSVVEKREMEQWYFRITAYADRLLKDLETLNWTNKVKVAQRNWIGKTEGLLEDWQIDGMDVKLTTFTTWPHTSWGSTFIVISPEHPIISTLVKGTSYEKGAKEFCKIVISENKKDPQAAIKDKKGYFIGRFAINHLTGWKMKIFIANFAVMEFGTGIVKCNPAHDQKDFEFAKKYDLPIVPVIVPKDGKPLDPKKLDHAYIGEGVMEKAGEFTGMPTEKAKGLIADYIINKGNGKKTVTMHLRDWCISRQRYWGPPIPMIYCDACKKWYPVAEEDLPVKLPFIKNYQPTGTGKAPLAQDPDFYHVKCPHCGGQARRETDVSDTFLDSAWYQFRYPSTRCAASGQVPWDPEITKKWLPVNIYIGGAEHSVLHLLYSRFITMVFHDMGLLDFDEPFTRFYAHGLIIAEGAKMSKSRGNVIIPDSYIKKYGADTLRTYLMFLGPFDHGGDFRDTGIAGMYKFLSRVWRLANSVILNPDTIGTKNLKNTKAMHRCIKEVTEDLENLRYNTAIAHIMEYVNQLTENNPPADGQITEKHIKSLLLLLAPFAPHMTEELWQEIQLTVNSKQKTEKEVFNSIHKYPWPSYDEKFLVEDQTIIVVQINGRLRDSFSIQSPKAALQEEVEKKAKSSAKVQKHLEGKTIRKTVFVPGKLINFVV